MIKIGCAGFPVATKKYQTHLPVVELQKLGSGSPKRETLARWKETAPDHFEFIVCASRQITHPLRSAAFKGATHLKNGSFDKTSTVYAALQKTLRHAAALNSKLIYFDLPTQFMPGPDNVARMQAFFGRIDRGALQFIWNPPKAWPLSLIERVSAHLRLVPAQNPLSKTLSTQPHINYFRINRSHGEFIDDHAFELIRRACGRKLSYVVFDNGSTAFESAAKFQNWVSRS